jgi:hypothetical protein
MPGSGVLKACRWQYISSGVEHPRYRVALGSLTTEVQARRIDDALSMRR